MITAYSPHYSVITESLVGFSYIPLGVNHQNVYYKPIICNILNEFIVVMDDILYNIGAESLNLTMDGITEITEEEFYKID